MTTADRLRDLFDRSGLTQIEVARRMGQTSTGVVSNLLSGKRADPSIGTVARFLAATGFRFADLDDENAE